MNDPAPWEQQITRLRTLSHEILALARAGEWEILAEREVQRRRVIEEVFAQPVLPAAAPDLAACVHEVLSSDSTVLALAQAEQSQRAQRLRALTRRRKACLAYAIVKEG